MPISCTGGTTKKQKKMTTLNIVLLFVGIAFIALFVAIAAVVKYTHSEPDRFTEDQKMDMEEVEKHWEDYV